MSVTESIMYNTQWTDPGYVAECKTSKWNNTYCRLKKQDLVFPHRAFFT